MAADDPVHFHVAGVPTILSQVFYHSFHLVDSSEQWRDVLAHCGKDHVSVHFEIVVHDNVSHSHDVAPRNVGILGEQSSGSDLVEPLDTFTHGYELHADTVKQQHAAGRIQQVICTVHAFSALEYAFERFGYLAE